MNFRRRGTVLSVTKATLRTESRNLETSMTAVAILSVGRRCRYGGKVPSSWREVIDFASLAKPTRRSLLEVGAIATVTVFVFAIVRAASARVRARSSAEVVISGSFGVQLISRTAKRYLSVAARVIDSLLYQHEFRSMLVASHLFLLLLLLDLQRSRKFR